MLSLLKIEMCCRLLQNLKYCTFLLQQLAADAADADDVIIMCFFVALNKI